MVQYSLFVYLLCIPFFYVPFHSVPFCSVPSWPALFHSFSILFCQFHLIPFSFSLFSLGYFIPNQSILFSIQFNSILCGSIDIHKSLVIYIHMYLAFPPCTKESCLYWFTYLSSSLLRLFQLADVPFALCWSARRRLQTSHRHGGLLRCWRCASTAVHCQRGGRAVVL